MRLQPNNQHKSKHEHAKEEVTEKQAVSIMGDPVLPAGLRHGQGMAKAKAKAAPSRGRSWQSFLARVFF
jgi:hypothetical protein